MIVYIDWGLCFPKIIKEQYWQEGENVKSAKNDYNHINKSYFDDAWSQICFLGLILVLMHLVNMLSNSIVVYEFGCKCVVKFLFGN